MKSSIQTRGQSRTAIFNWSDYLPRGQLKILQLDITVDDRHLATSK